MENIRHYCEYIDLYFQIEPNQEKQESYYKEKGKCLDAISNKLLLMDDDNKKYYAQMITYYLETNASTNFDLDSAFRWNGDRSISDDATLCVAELIWNIYRLFITCKVDMNLYFKRLTIPNMIEMSPGQGKGRNNLFDSTLSTKIYNSCNGNQWETIPMNDFTNLLTNNGIGQSFIIRKDEINRTKVVFRVIANRINDKNIRKEWIEDIKKNIFNSTDFTKATLRTDRTSGGYSSIDVEFKAFIDSL